LPRQLASADPLDVSGAPANCGLDFIEHRPFLTREWGIDEVSAVLGLLAGVAGTLRSWLMSTRQMALYEMVGQGRIADVLGHLPEAGHLVVYVPGMRPTCGILIAFSGRGPKSFRPGQWPSPMALRSPPSLPGS
jgi:hypothetical protein